jgi:hypothetical protein
MYSALAFRVGEGNLGIFSSHLGFLPRALLILSRMISGYGLGVGGSGVQVMRISDRRKDNDTLETSPSTLGGRRFTTSLLRHRIVKTREREKIK